MKKILTALAILACLIGTANAQIIATNVVPNGDMENVSGNITNTTAAGGQTAHFVFPATGGNPDGYGGIAVDGANGWAVFILGNAVAGDPLAVGPVVGDNNSYLRSDYSFTELFMVPGTTNRFFMDMKYETGGIYTGLQRAGFKVEAWTTNDTQGTKATSAEMFFTLPDTNWHTVSFDWVIPSGKQYLKVVPLISTYGGDLVATRARFDNFSVRQFITLPLSVDITFPAEGSEVFTNFSIGAQTTVLPGATTNVAFYSIQGGITNLLGNSASVEVYGGQYSLLVFGAATGPAQLFAVATGTNQAGVFIQAQSDLVNVTLVDTTPQATVYVDPTDAWNSYVNGYSPSGFPPESQALVYEGFYGQADLQAAFSASGPNGILTLGPAVQGDTNIFWYNYGFGPGPGESGAVGDVDMEANFYVQPTGLNGNNLTFKGTNISANLIDPGTNNLADVGWTCEVFIKDLPASLNPTGTVEVSASVVAGQPFSISLATIADPTRVLQYGFRTFGPNVLPIDRDLYSNIVFQSLPPPPPTNVFVDVNAGWQAYINNATNIGGGAGYQGTNFAFGSTYGLQEITAAFDGCSLILTPATSADTNWFVGGIGASGTPSIYIAEANTYVQDDTMVGRTVIFSGTVNSTGLYGSTAPSGDGWSGTAFIKDLAPDYSSAIITSTPLVNGAFSITNATQPSAGRHVQYGFALFGPPVWTTDGGLYGNVNIQNIGLTAAPTLTATRNGANIDLSFYAQSGFDYTVQYKTNLTSTSWTQLAAPSAGACATKVVSDSIGNPNRYYRLLVE